MALKREQGSALLTALFIVTLVAIAATAMSLQLQQDIYRTRAVLTHDRLKLASEAVTFWAMNALNEKKNHFLVASPEGKVMDFPGQWRSVYPEVKLDGQLYDLQARYNLNNTGDKVYRTIFLNLTKGVIADLEKVKKISKALQAWLRPYRPEQDDDWMVYYAQLKPPYYPAQLNFAHISEFRLVEGVDAKTGRALSGLMTALPEVTAINFNTALPQVLSALNPGMPQSKLKALLAARGKKGIDKLDRLTPLLQELGIRSTNLTLESNYFMVVTQAKSNEMSLTTCSLLKRKKDKKNNWHVQLIRTSIGVC